MRLSDEEKKRVRELYDRDRENRAKSFKTFHGEYGQVPEQAFVSYWLLYRHQRNNSSIDSSVVEARATPARRTKTLDKKYLLCADPDRMG